MDMFPELWHSGVRETRRHCPTITGAPQQSGGAVETGPLLPSRGPHGSIVHKLARALDAVLPAQRQGGLEAPAHPGPSAANETPSEARIDRPLETGGASGWLFHRDVDHPARGRANPPALGSRLSSGACVENTGRPGVELPEARTAGHSTQPQENPRVEAARVAAYKKKPGDC